MFRKRIEENETVLLINCAITSINNSLISYMLFCYIIFYIYLFIY